MISLLQRYLQINTAHPYPDYAGAIELFSKQAIADGFMVHRIDLPSGLPVLVITFEGRDASLPSLALNHHMDVVPVGDHTAWQQHPFAGRVVDGIIYGRGTQDMKGVGVIHYAAMQQLKQQGFIPQRSIHMIMVPHEEVGGYQGVGQLIDNHYFRSLNLGFVLDEGLASGKEATMYLKISERKPMQLEIHAIGSMVHGSRLHCVNAIHELTLFLAEIARMQQQQQAICDQPLGKLLSLNITSFTAGVVQNGAIAVNMVPEKATATIDMRVPPAMKLIDARAMIDAMMLHYPQLSYEVTCQANDLAIDDDKQQVFFQVIAQALANHGIKAQAYHAEEASDMRFYQAQGIVGIGLSPFTMVENIHRIDECIRISDLERGRDIMVTLLQSFCG